MLAFEFDVFIQEAFIALDTLENEVHVCIHAFIYCEVNAGSLNGSTYTFHYPFRHVLKSIWFELLYVKL